MDFKGETTAEAANRLLAFVSRIANEIGVSLDEERGGISSLHNDFKVTARGASGATFYLETAVGDDVFVAVQHKQNPTKEELAAEVSQNVAVTTRWNSGANQMVHIAGMVCRSNLLST